MTGFLGQKFDFTGEDGAWYSLVADDSLHMNMVGLIQYALGFPPSCLVD